jgi:hypothetical protein
MYIAYFVVTSFIVLFSLIHVYAAMLNLQGEAYTGLSLWTICVLSRVSSVNTKSINALIYLQRKSVCCFTQI